MSFNREGFESANNLNNDTALLCDSHYYKWLVQNCPDNLNYKDTMLIYMSTVWGFVKGEDFISSENLFYLKAIEDIYAISVLQPKYREKYGK